MKVKETCLQQMVTSANQAYPDHLILTAFDHLEMDLASPRVLLASYIAGMIQDLHDANSNEGHNLQRVITELKGGADDLNLVIGHLQSLRYALEVQIDGEALGQTPLYAEAVPEGALLVVPASYATEKGLKDVREES